MYNQEPQSFTGLPMPGTEANMNYYPPPNNNPNNPVTVFPTGVAVQPMQPGYPQPMQPGYPQPMPPQDGNVQNIMQTAAVTYTLNQQMVQMFGPLMFNFNDPYYIAHKNTPKKIENSKHLVVLILNIYALTSIILGGVFYSLKLLGNSPVGSMVGIIIQGYLLYVISIFCCGDMSGYIHNLKPFTAYEASYNTVVRSAGYFRFHIECYHYVTRRDAKGRTHTSKVVTHTATQNFHPMQCIDESGVLGSIYDTKQYIFLHCLNRFYFDSDASANKFQNAYNSFINRNRRDSHQDYSSSYILPGFEEEIGFTVSETQHTKPLFYIFNFLLMGYPYAAFFECEVARYEIVFLKKLVC